MKVEEIVTDIRLNLSKFQELNDTIKNNMYYSHDLAMIKSMKLILKEVRAKIKMLNDTLDIKAKQSLDKKDIPKTKRTKKTKKTSISKAKRKRIIKLENDLEKVKLM